jgi:hypothetical protein
MPIPTWENIALFFLVIGTSGFALALALGGIWYLNKTSDKGDR